MTFLLQKNKICNFYDTSVFMTGKDLKAKRKSKGWTQSLLAQKIGVSKGTVINYEKGKKIPESKNKILQEVFVGHVPQNYELNEKLNVLNEELRTYAKEDKNPSNYILEEILSKFHPVEIVAYLDRNRELFFNLEEFRLLAKNIVGTSEIEQLKEDIQNIKNRLNQH